MGGIKRKRVATRRLASPGKLSKRMTGVARGFGNTAAPGDDKCPQRCPEDPDRGIGRVTRRGSARKLARARKLGRARVVRGF